MISATDWKQQAQEQIRQANTLPWLLHPAIARTAFLQSELPTRKTERWKYTPVSSLLQQDFLQPVPASDIDETAARARLAPLPNAARIVLVNGQLHPGLSDFAALEQQGILTLFSQSSPEQRDIINQYLGTAIDLHQHPFAALNDSARADGLLLHAPALQKLPQPVQVVYLGNALSTPAWAQTRLLVVAEPGAELHVLEQFDSLGEQGHLFHNHLTEILLQPNARLQHLRVQTEQEALHQISGLHVKLARDTHYDLHTLAFGSQLKRSDINVHFAGENASAVLNGVFLAKHHQHIDHHLNLEHAAPHCTSTTAFKGFVTDESRAIFNGRIHIHPGAQKTEANLGNKNLLLSKQAELNTKPELEIYADDVRCSHGASIGQLDEKSLFYFQSRGIDKASAEAMLCIGFINEKVAQIPSEPVQALVQERLGHFFNDVDKLNALWNV